MHDQIVPATPNLPTGRVSENISAKIMLLVKASRADSTQRAYRRGFEHFTAWCELQGIVYLPATPETVAGYIADMAEEGRAVSTINQRVAAIRFAHRAAGVESPTNSLLVETTMGGIRRTIGVAQKGKDPLTTPELTSMVANLPNTLMGTRDKALLLVGYAGAFRRSELVGLDFEDISFQRDGVKLLLRKSKTDQEGEGRQIAIVYGKQLATCPVRALKAWLAASGITSGPLFRSMNRGGSIKKRLGGKDVARMIKRAAKEAGLDAVKYSGHSLRAGLATAAARAGASERLIMKQTGHKDERMVRKYIREGELFQQNVSGMVGL